MSLSLETIFMAHKRIELYLNPTPLLRCEALERELQFPGKIFLKLENMHPTGSFKVRGAFIM